MKYLLLIYENESDWTSASEKEQQEIFGEYMAFSSRLHESGRMVAAEALQPTAAATTVRVRDGKRRTTDGPFAETREQLGGFYLIEAEDLDQAIALAAEIPGARTGSVEVRPILPTPSPADVAP